MLVVNLLLTHLNPNDISISDDETQFGSEHEPCDVSNLKQTDLRTSCQDSCCTNCTTSWHA